MPPTMSLLRGLPRPPPSHYLSALTLRPYSTRKPSTTTTTTAAATTTPTTSDINPPASTRPAPLDLPAALPSSAPTADKLKRYVTLGRAYLTFYKTGLKNVYHNYRASIPLRRELGLPLYLPTSPVFPPPTTATTPNGKGKGTGKQGSSQLTRSALQLTHRAAHDLRRLIPFSLLLVICGELTPLVILVLGNAVTPFTCRVPGQIAKHRRRRAGIVRAVLAQHTGRVVARNPSGAERDLDVLRGFARPDWVERASREEVLRACAVFGLTGERGPWAVGPLVEAVYRPRLRRYVQYLAVDDGLIRGAGGVAAMEGAEVRIAVEERGGVGVVEGAEGVEEGWEAERVERRWLERWVQK
ncbi:hypothetical protein BDV59DRAFT_16967 [Aspergillus ambiguus]|uniref:uncharacterized protein n=1 Tax=Aspergillus ambiguus TaxID=176160 RepID=UPI003CCE01FE